MILSMQDLFSDKQALTASAVSTNIIDLGVSGTPVHGVAPLKRDLGQGNKIPLLVQVVEKFAGATGLTIQLQTATDEAFTTPITLVSQTIAVADLKAGARFSLPVVPYGAVQRYLRLNYTVAGSGTSGKVTAGFTMGNDETLPY